MPPVRTAFDQVMALIRKEMDTLRSFTVVAFFVLWKMQFPMLWKVIPSLMWNFFPANYVADSKFLQKIYFPHVENLLSAPGK